jgi:glycosyltransferase involved in cell wall biosynthesis
MVPPVSRFDFVRIERVNRTSKPQFVTYVYAVAILLFLGLTVSASYHLQWVRRLPRLSADEKQPFREEHPLCSVILAARNEEDRIEATLERLLAQSSVSLEIIAIDDRSTDNTAAILDRMAARETRIKVGRITHLPENWLGKCHACHVGAAMARGEWLLFTDADCWLKASVIARALRMAAFEGADHIAMIPGVSLETFPARAWYLMFVTSFLSWIAGVNRNNPRAHFGIGAFNLVRASAYRECGGHEALRLTILDDVRLGLLLSRCGKRTRAFLGGNDVECHWGKSLSDVMRVMEKNYFAALNYRVEVVVAGGTAFTLLFSLLVIGLFSGSPMGVAAAISPLGVILPNIILAQRIGWPWWYALGVPVIMPVFLYAMLRSTFLTLRQGGVRWRETFYPLELLRAHGVK